MLVSTSKYNFFLTTLNNFPRHLELYCHMASKDMCMCMVINKCSLAKPQAAPAFEIELSTWEIDICFVSETGLNNKIPSSLIFPKNDNIVRKDRDASRKEWGVAIIH